MWHDSHETGGYQVDSYDAYEIDKYAIQSATHNFPEIVEHGDVFGTDFTEYKDIDFLMGGSPCVPAGSKIKTDKGYKAIEDIEIGDMVLTHKNRYRPVSRLYERQSSHIYHIKFNGGDTLDITGNHPVYTYRDNEFMFVRTDELTINDYVCININQQQKQLEYSDDILWLLGRTLADGYYSKSKHCIKTISSSDGKTYKVYSVSNGTIGIKNKEYPIKLQDGYYIIRKLSVNECKRLQQVPDWYEFPVSDSQAYKQLGNGWSIEVILHLIKSCLAT